MGGLAMEDKLEDELRAMSGSDEAPNDEARPDANEELSQMMMQGAPAPPEIIVDDTDDPPTPIAEEQPPQAKSTGIQEPVGTNDSAARKGMVQPQILEVAERESDTAQQFPVKDQGDAPELGKTPRNVGGASGEDTFPHERMLPRRQAYETREDSETDSGPSYTYDRAGPTEGRLGGNTPPKNRTQPKMPSELTGIGSGHTVHDDEFRQNICSDEDIGLSSSTATQNVTSQA